MTPTQAQHEAAAKAVREEIVRQHRENERGRCLAGRLFYEEEVAPGLIADAALTAAAEVEAEAEEDENNELKEYVGRKLIERDTDISRAVAATIERCAHVAESFIAKEGTADVIAAAIRALKDKT